MKKFVYVLFGWLVFQFGCDVNQLEFDNVKVPTVESLVALPIGELNYTLRELIDSLGDVGVTIEEDSATTLLSLVYTDTIEYSASDNEFVSIADVVKDFSIPLPETPAVPSDQVIQIDTTVTLTYDAQEGDGLDSVVYQSGTLSSSMSSGVSGITYTMAVNNTTLNSTAASFAGNVPDTGTIDLAGYSTTLTNDAGNNFFSLTLSITVNLTTGQSIGAGESIDVNLSYLNQSFQSLFGYFGNDTVSVGTLSFPVDFFESLGGNSAIEFRDPQVNMNFTNSLGIPIGLVFNEVYGISSDSTTGQSDTTYLEGTVVNSPQLIGSPSVDEIGQSVASTISLNTNNSNLNEIFGNTPTEISFSVSGISNPFDTEATNFFIPGGDNNIEALVEIRLPLEMKLNDLTREISLNINTDFSIDEVDSAVLRIVTLNLLPFSTLMDVQFLDSLDSVTYALDQTLVMATPFINVDFVANEAEPNVADLSLSREGIDALLEAKKINLVLTLNTPETLNSRDIYPEWRASYDLTVKVSTLLKLKVDL